MRKVQGSTPAATGYSQFGEGSVKLIVLFNDPTDVE